MFLRTVMCGHSAYDWKTMPMFRLFGGTFVRLVASKTVRSPNAIDPSSAVSRPAMQRSVVVFPQPLGPRSTRNSPGSISRSRLSIAVVGVLPPNRLDSPRMLTLDTDPPPCISAEGLEGGAGRDPLPRTGGLLEELVPGGLECFHCLRRERLQVLLARLDEEGVLDVLPDRPRETLRQLLTFLGHQVVGEQLRRVPVRGLLEDHRRVRRVPRLRPLRELEVDRRALRLVVEDRRRDERAHSELT